MVNHVNGLLLDNFIKRAKQFYREDIYFLNFIFRIRSKSHCQGENFASDRVLKARQGEMGVKKHAHHYKCEQDNHVGKDNNLEQQRTNHQH